MSARLATVWYWLGVSVAVVLVAAAVLWNAWTFNLQSMAQRQLDSLRVEATAGAAEAPAPGSPEAAELDLLLDADRRGILDENFQALLTDPQKRAIAQARRERLADRAGDRQTSLIFGVVLVLGAVAAFGVGRAIRRRAN